MSLPGLSTTKTPVTAGALTDLRIVELGSGPVTGMAGMILADFGAEVLRIDRPGGDPLGQLPAAPMWARGKYHLVLDVSDADDLDEVLAVADVLICNWRPAALKRKGIDYKSLHDRHPHLVYCHITGFGPGGPMAEVPGYEHVVAAYAGRMMLFSGIVDRDGPVLSAVQVGIHVATQSAVAGVLAALLQRGETGVGRLVETSLLQGMLPYEMGGLIGRQFESEYEQLLPYVRTAPEPPPPSLYYHPAQAGDGRWMQFGNLLPHLFDNFLITTGLIDVLADPAYDQKQMLLRPEEAHEAFRERMLKRIQERSSAEWMQEFVADGGIVGTTYQTTQAALNDPDVVANGHVLKQDNGSVQLGPVARLAETPAAPGSDSMPGDALIKKWRTTPRMAPSEPRKEELPLAGIRVVELATIIAAPLGTSFLADMGADVVKVEQVGGDPFRSLLGGLGAARVNTGKRSVSINLKTEEGRDIVLKLVASADVVVHNYRPGVPERLGIGYEQVRELNPGVIYRQANGYGPDGPGAHRPSTHPIPGAAMGGVMYQMREALPSTLQDFKNLRRWTSRLMRANELNPDPNTAVVIATAALLGLSARTRTGQGQLVGVDMFGTNAYANADDFLSYPGKPGRAMPDELMYGFSPTYRLYPCRDGKWIFLGLITEKESAGFIEALTEMGIDVPDRSRLHPESGDTGVLSDLFASRDAADWQSMLAPRGIACVAADRNEPPAFWLQDGQAAAYGFVGPAHHPVHGAYLRHGPLVIFDRQPGELKGPPSAGQHHEEVLAECGYEATETDAMLQSGVLWQE